MNYVSRSTLGAAQARCTLEGALPNNWENWFPTNIALYVDVSDSYIRAKHVRLYAIKRLKEDKDNARHIEAAMCMALLFYLNDPDDDLILDVAEIESVENG